MFRLVTAAILILAATLAPAFAQSPAPAATAFDRLKAMEGEWVDVTGAGNTVVESFPVGTPQEMTTVYHRDGTSIVLTHYCAGGTQPRMRAREITGDRMKYEFEGGSNIDVAKTSHMHNMDWEFIGADEAKFAWHN